MVVEMYYAVDASSEMVYAFRTCLYCDSYVIGNYEGKAFIPDEARAVMADYIGELKSVYGMKRLCERYDHRCRFDGCMLGIAR